MGFELKRWKSLYEKDKTLPGWDNFFPTMSQHSGG